MVPDHEQLTL